MSIPDYISPIVGYRTWLWDNVGLRSLCGERWHPGRVLAARCRAAAVVGTIAGRAEGDDAHDAPQPNCTCGVYASKSFEHLHTTKYARCGLYGEVNLWGTVVEHEQGWRTQFAYPKSLYLPPDTLPHSSAPIQDRLRGLIAYGINIFVGDDTRNIPSGGKIQD